MKELINIKDLITEWNKNNPNEKLTLYSELIPECTVDVSGNGIKINEAPGVVLNDFGSFSITGEPCILWPSKENKDWSNFDTSSAICPFNSKDIVISGIKFAIVSKSKRLGFKASCYFDGYNSVEFEKEFSNWKDWKLATLDEMQVFRRGIEELGYTLRNREVQYDSVMYKLINMNSHISGEMNVMMSEIQNLKNYIPTQSRKMLPTEEELKLNSRIKIIKDSSTVTEVLTKISMVLSAINISLLVYLCFFK